eukprot:ANDGO_03230.mRNA.1 Tetratricopeptide repeat protein 21 homolog
MEQQVLSFVVYYSKLGLYQHIRTLCDQGLKKRPSDSFLIFWRSFSLLKQGAVGEAVRGFESLLSSTSTSAKHQGSNNELDFCALTALIFSHMQARLVDDDQVTILTSHLVTLTISEVPEKALVLACAFLWLSQDDSLPNANAANTIQKARDIASQKIGNALLKDPNGQAAQALSVWMATLVALRGWMDVVAIERPSIVQKSGVFFEVALAGGRKDVLGLWGKAKFLEFRNQLPDALESLNNLVVSAQWFLPALTEKARILVRMGDWDQAVETGQRVLGMDAFNLEALRLFVMYFLVRHVGADASSAAALRLADVTEALSNLEPTNHSLFAQVAESVHRFVASPQLNENVIKQAISLIERACQIAPKVASYFAHWGSLILCTQPVDVTSARMRFRKARELDDTNTESFLGLIQCDLIESKLKSAEEQLLFVSALTDSLDPHLAAQVHVLQAQFMWKSESKRQESLEHLSQAYAIHSKYLSSLPAGPSEQYAFALNPHFLMRLARECMIHAPSDPIAEGEHIPVAVGKILPVLDLLAVHAPACLEAALLHARCKYLVRDFDAAKTRCSSLVSQIHQSLNASSGGVSPASATSVKTILSSAYLLLAQIHLAEGRAPAALSALDQALASDFSIRDLPLFSIIKAKVLVVEATGSVPQSTPFQQLSSQQQQQLEEACRLLEQTIDLPGNRSSSVQDRASLFVELSALYSRMGRVIEATKFISDAQSLFRGTPEEGRITLSNASIALYRGEIDQALSILKSVSRSSPYFMAARMQMARVYLDSRHDRRAYTRCLEEVAEDSPSAQSFIMLGDAMMNIQDPESAIRYYSSARSLLKGTAAAGGGGGGGGGGGSNANVNMEIIVASKIGRALVATYDYKKAIDYYSSAVKADPTRTQLRHDLAELYIRLRDFEKAEAILRDGIEQKKTSLFGMIDDVRSQIILSRVYVVGFSNREKALQTLEDARAKQQQVLKRARSEAPDMLISQTEFASELAFQTGKVYIDIRQVDKAKVMFEEALRLNVKHARASLALCHLLLRVGDMEGCRQQCESLLKVDPSNTEATMLLSDVLIRQSKAEMATEPMEALVKRNPTQYRALVELMAMLRRAGRLGDCSKYLKAAERMSARARFDPGFFYAKGLYARFTNNPRDALRDFNHARGSPEWGRQATIQMVEVFLNPDNRDAWTSSGSGSGDSESSNTPDIDVRDNIQSAEKLLDSIASTGSPQEKKEVQLLRGFCKLMRGTKTDQEAALNIFSSLGRDDSDDIKVLTAMAVALQIMKQTPKARNILKRIVKMPFEAEFADEFETAYLLLADIYISNGKYDQAQELLKKAISCNNSCGRAWEALGLIYEKESSYTDAAEHYEKAWILGSEHSAAVGYKLAFNYLKAKRYIDAIDMCHRVLALNENYPKIRKEILEKARAQIRP